MHLIGVRRESDQRVVASSDSSQLIRATEVERDILRVEDNCYELLSKLARESLTKTAIAARLVAMQEAQAELISRIATMRRTGKLDEIYCTALDERMASLVFLCERARRKALAR